MTNAEIAKQVEAALVAGGWAREVVDREVPTIAPRLIAAVTRGEIELINGQLPPLLIRESWKGNPRVMMVGDVPFGLVAGGIPVD